MTYFFCSFEEQQQKRTMEINTNFYQKTGTEKGSIYFTFTYRTVRFRISAKETADKKTWDKQGQKVNKKDPHSAEKNKRLLKKKNILIQIIEELEKQDIEVNQKIVNQLYKKQTDIEVYKIKPRPKPKLKNPNGKAEKKEPQTFWEVLEHYRKYSGYSGETIRKWNQVEGHLKSFKPDFDFKDVTEQFYNDYFLDYLVNVPICDNTIDKHIAQIKSLCNYAVKRFKNLEISTDYIDFKRIYKNPQRLSLTWDEVEAIEKFKPLTPEQEQAKDMFIIACYTGLRWQNVSDLKPHNFIEEGGQTYLNVVTYKNGNPLRFPLPKSVKKIIEKYQREIPKSYNSDVNKEIQKVARACKLKEKIYVRRMFKKKVVEEPFEKWQKVTMHVGRHTFACEFLRRNKGEGLNALKALSNLLNHSSTSITEIYWNMISAEKDKMLLNTFN